MTKQIADKGLQEQIAEIIRNRVLYEIKGREIGLIKQGKLSDDIAGFAAKEIAKLHKAKIARIGEKYLGELKKEKLSSLGEYEFDLAHHKIAGVKELLRRLENGK